MRGFSQRMVLFFVTSSLACDDSSFYSRLKAVNKGRLGLVMSIVSWRQEQASIQETLRRFKFLMPGRRNGGENCHVSSVILTQGSLGKKSGRHMFSLFESALLKIVRNTGIELEVLFYTHFQNCIFVPGSSGAGLLDQISTKVYSRKSSEFSCQK